MKILKAEQFTAHNVVTDEKDCPDYIRFSSDSWGVWMGESVELVYACEELEAEFQRAISLKEPTRPDDKERLEWIEQRLGHLGIDVRQSKHHVQMRYYLELLKEEIGMTERFLSEDGTIQ